MRQPKVHCKYDEMVPADSELLVPHPQNPNRHPPEQLRLLGELIQRHGWRRPVVVSRRSGLIVRGHGRVMAALSIGAQVPLQWQEYESEGRELADLAADNRLSELFEKDQTVLTQMLADLSEKGELSGYSDAEVKLMVDRLAQRQEALESRERQERRGPGGETELETIVLHFTWDEHRLVTEGLQQVIRQYEKETQSNAVAWLLGQMM